MNHRAVSGGSYRIPRRMVIIVFLGTILLWSVGCARKASVQETSEETTASSPTPVMVSTAMRGTIEETLKITGTAKADNEVDVVSEVSGKIARVYADVGDWVRQGQVLVQIDTEIAAVQADQAAAGVRSARVNLSKAEEALVLTDETTASAVRQAEVALAAARERLEQAKAARRLIEAQVNSQIEQARTAVQSAETQLAEIRAGARDQQRRQAEAQVRQAKAALDLAEQTHRRYKELFDNGVISQQQYDQVRTDYEVAQANYQQALESLSLVKEGARTEEVRLAELAVQQARQQLALAEAGRTQVEVADQDVAAAEQAVRQAEEQVRNARAGRRQVKLREGEVAAARAAIASAEAAHRAATVQLSKHVVRAPISGLVAMRNVDRGEGALPGTPLMRLVDIDPIRVDAIVNELDVERVHKGDRGMVIFDGLGDEQFVGIVTDISPQAVPGSRNYIVRVEVDNPGGRIKPGMFARIDLILETRSDTVLIVRDALVERDHGRQVYVVTDGVVDVRDVEIGAIRRNLVEILDGVREGEMVVISGQATLAEGQRVEPVQRTPNEEPEEQTT